VGALLESVVRFSTLLRGMSCRPVVWLATDIALFLTCSVLRRRVLMLTKLASGIASGRASTTVVPTASIGTVGPPCFIVLYLSAYEL
jgi:hypothetical protein